MTPEGVVFIAQVRVRHSEHYVRQHFCPHVLIDGRCDVPTAARVAVNRLPFATPAPPTSASPNNGISATDPSLLKIKIMSHVVSATLLTSASPLPGRVCWKNVNSGTLPAGGVDCAVDGPPVHDDDLTHVRERG